MDSIDATIDYHTLLSYLSPRERLEVEAFCNGQVYNTAVVRLALSKLKGRFGNVE